MLVKLSDASQLDKIASKGVRDQLVYRHKRYMTNLYIDTRGT